MRTSSRMTKILAMMVVVLTFVVVACGSSVEVGASSGEGGSSPDAGPIACAEQNDCPADEPCLEWRCEPSAHVCIAIVPSNAECHDAGAHADASPDGY
jgi:hypothetical protein